MKSTFTRIWMLILSALFLAATFEHNFSTLRLYSSGLTVKGFNIAMWSKVGLVAGIDLAIFFAISYIVMYRDGQRSLTPARTILFLTTTVSMGLNVYYMLKYAPDGTMAHIIGGVVGALTPIMVALLGWMEGDQKTDAGETSAPRQVKNKRIASRMQVSSMSTPQPQTPVRKTPAPTVRKVQHTSPLRTRITDLIQNDPSRSDRSIARELSCSPTTVGKARQALKKLKKK